MLRSLYVMLDYHIAATDGVQGTKIANKSAARCFRSPFATGEP